MYIETVFIISPSKLRKCSTQENRSGTGLTNNSDLHMFCDLQVTEFILNVFTVPSGRIFQFLGSKCPLHLHMQYFIICPITFRGNFCDNPWRSGGLSTATSADLNSFQPKADSLDTCHQHQIYGLETKLEFHKLWIEAQANNTPEANMCANVWINAALSVKLSTRVWSKSNM